MEKVWAAGPKTTISVGSLINAKKGTAMRSFKSKTLDRTFPVIYFLNSFERVSHKDSEHGKAGQTQDSPDVKAHIAANIPANGARESPNPKPSNKQTFSQSARRQDHRRGVPRPYPQGPACEDQG